MNDLTLAIAPARTYRRLASRRADCGWGAALARPAFAALLIGTALAIASTGRVTLGLVASLTLCWSFAPAWQLIAAAIVIAASPRRGVGMPRALDLFFAGHVPWSSWLLAAAAWIAAAGRPFDPAALLLSALIPAIWTPAIVFAFCRTVLHETRRGALIRTAAHQAMIWTFAATVFALAVAALPRVLRLLGQ
jgi:hypothetical protein